MRNLILAGLLAMLAAPALAADWGSYENARFGYIIDVPPGFDWHAEAENGDGRVFRSADGTLLLRVYGGNIMEESFEAAVSASMGYAREAGWALSYERTTPGWASWSGTRNGMVLYARTVALCSSQYASFELEYPERDLDAMRGVIERLVGSLRASGAGAGC